MTVTRHHIFDIWKQAEREVALEVCTNSMQPTLNVEDFVFLRLSGTVEYKTGDIVVFKRGEDLVVHRIVKQKTIDGEAFFCEKGDNACRWSWITREDLLGRVVAIADKHKIEKMPPRQFRLHNRLMGFLGGGLVTSYEAVSPIKELVPEPAKSGLITKLKHRAIKVNNRLFNFIGAAVCRASDAGKKEVA
jgi:hypothetical protein